MPLTQPSFGAEMFPPNQRSKPIFRKNAEHYVAYNTFHVIYHDTISCNIFKLDANWSNQCTNCNYLTTKSVKF